MYKPVLLLAVLSNALIAAGITLQVSSETAPPGGYAQFKISLTAPTLVSSGSVTMNFDPTIFGPAVGLAAFSATGDQTGSATVQGQQVVATFTSASAGFGQLPDLPILVVTVPVLATAKIGATSSITATSTIGAVNPGAFTVGGSLSIQNVTPGGGLLPAGTVVAINGTGFDATTTVSIDGVSASTQLVSAQQINLTLNGATEMTGKHVHLANAAGAQIDYFAALPGTVTSPYHGYPSFLILPSLSQPSNTAVQWFFDFGATPSSYSVLQNPNNFPVTATYYYVDDDDPTTTESVVIPAYGQYVGLIIGGLGNIYMTVSAPVLMAEASTDTENDLVFGFSRPAQLTSPGLFGFQQPGPATRSWSWQVGTPAPPPQTASVAGGSPFTATVSGSASSWLTVTPTSGNSGYTSLTLTPVVAGLAAGTYTGTVTLTPQFPPVIAQFPPAPVSIAVTITVTAQPQLLSDGTGAVLFSMVQGAAPPPTQAYSVGSNGNPATFTATLAPNAANWLSVTPSSGVTPLTLTLAVNPAGLTAGTYQSAFIIQGPINALTVTVSLAISPSGPIPTLPVSPGALFFSLPSGQTVPSPAQLISTGTQLSSVSVKSEGNWLTASIQGNAVGVTATAVSLSPALYLGSVTITSTSNLVTTVPVTLTVTGSSGPTQLTVAPAGITLTARAGTTATANFSVTPISGPTPFTIGMSPTPPTLSLQFPNLPASSSGKLTAPLTLQVSVSAAIPGTFQESIIISWNGGSATIPVILYATPSPSLPPVMSYIVNSGSEIPGSISPGELITIFGSGLGGQPASLQLNGDLTAKTTLGGTQVLINAVPAPMIFTSTGQLNAIVPFEVGSSGAASIQVASQGILSSAWGVPVAPAAPSILTSAGAGVGQGAIVNQDHSLNYETNPAARGTVIEIYTTGGGQTSPTSSTGSVARVAASLQLPVTISIGGVDAQVLYAGNAPGEIEGVVQINVMVPPTVAPGTLPMVVTIGGVASPPGVTVSVQ